MRGYERYEQPKYDPRHMMPPQRNELLYYDQRYDREFQQMHPTPTLSHDELYNRGFPAEQRQGNFPQPSADHPYAPYGEQPAFV